MNPPKQKPGERKYRVCALITISMHTDVFASNQEEAKDKALDNPLMSLCHQCSEGSVKEEWVTSGELDGELFGIFAEGDSE